MMVKGKFDTQEIKYATTRISQNKARDSQDVRSCCIVNDLRVIKIIPRGAVLCLVWLIFDSDSRV